ncbi:MAG: hypothetical protein ABSE92_13265 [Terriglobales bacterium]|jgi:hypothetical protein
MKKVQTYFEQIPVEVAKKIAEEEFAERNAISHRAIPRILVKKTRSQMAHVRLGRRNGA